MTQSALAAIVTRLKHEPLDDAVDRKAVRHARNYVTRQDTPYGTLHQVVKVPALTGGSLDIEVQSPLAMFYVAAQESEQFAHLLSRTHEIRPCTPSEPWRLCVYADEVVPGNVLGYDNRRKVWAIYLSILDFGPGALADEEAWLVAAVVRSNIVCTFEGGVAALVNALLKLMFDPNKFDASTAGVILRVQGK